LLRLANNLSVLARIRSSQEWWRYRRNDFRLCVSQIVVDECLQGHPKVVSRRSQLLADLTVFPVTADVIEVARQLIERGFVPAKVGSDAGHIAHAAVHGCDFLLTWNFKHINNPFQSRSIRETIETYGFRSPVICTPDNLLRA